MMIIIILLEPNLCCVRAEDELFYEFNPPKRDDSNSCVLCMSIHIPLATRILWAIRNLVRQKLAKAHRKNTFRGKPLTKYFSSFNGTICNLNTNLLFFHSRTFCLQCLWKLMCWVEEECSPHLFDICCFAVA